MATVVDRPAAQIGLEERFFLRAAIAMAVVVASAFSFNLAMGRSSFHAPPLVHAHAIAFMGWVAIYLLQNVLVATGRIDLHRLLGWIGAGWIAMMVVLGNVALVLMVRRGGVPFTFQPLHLLIYDSVIIFTFAGLTYAAIVLRRRTDWHRRLHYCGMSMLLGPAFARLLPLPLLIPWELEASYVALMIFPAVAAWSDVRRLGQVHPAWRWGIGTMVMAMLLTEVITHSAVGTVLYREATAGSPGAAIAPLDYAPPPWASRPVQARPDEVPNRPI